jgi:hypothetical protein
MVAVGGAEVAGQMRQEVCLNVYNCFTERSLDESWRRSTLTMHAWNKSHILNVNMCFAKLVPLRVPRLQLHLAFAIHPRSALVAVQQPHHLGIALSQYLISSLPRYLVVASSHYLIMSTSVQPYTPTAPGVVWRPLLLCRAADWPQVHAQPVVPHSGARLPPPPPFHCVPTLLPARMLDYALHCA